MSFDSEYQKLNPAQKQAVDTIEGPVMVIAGPGTGKTQVLTLRIANILRKTDAAPHNILALTFTEAAAITMRARLLSLIGPDSYRVRIQTFHGFCQDIITQYPEYFSLPDHAIPATDVETVGIMEELLSDPDLKALRTPGSKYHYLKKILQAIATLKGEGITPDMYDALKKSDTDREKQRELGLLYRRFQEELTRRRRFDFTDMIMEVLKSFSTYEQLLSAVQESIGYLLVDEYQDTNGAQNQIIDQLSAYWGESANVFVVGDPHQTIYRFQGASFENTIGFLTRYPTTTTITLLDGYRCPQTIYTAAHALIAHNTNANELLDALADTHPGVRQLVDGLSRPLVTNSAHPHAALTYTVLPDDDLERAWIASWCSDHTTSSVAILVKTNVQATRIAEALSQYGVPHTIARNTNALETSLGKSLTALFSTLVALKTAQESPTLWHVLSSPWAQLPKVALMSLMRAFSRQKTESSLFSFLLLPPATLKSKVDHGVLPEEIELIQKYLRKLSELSIVEESSTLPNTIARIYSELAIPTWALTEPETQEHIAVLRAFAQLATTLASTNQESTLLTLAKTIDTMMHQELSVDIAPIFTSATQVTVSTIHKAKGQEWDHVFLPFFRDGNWGGGRGQHPLPLPEGIVATATDDHDLEDERRLLYVAMTRARHQLHLSSSQTTQQSSKTTETLPSQFFSELPQELLYQEDGSVITNDAAIHHSRLLGAPTPIQYTSREREWIASIVKDLPLSVSLLNTYLRDPQEFFTSHVLKIPKTQESHLGFGNAIHAALEHYYTTYHRLGHTHPSPDTALAAFSARLEKEILHPQDRRSRQMQGERVLSSYLEEHRHEFPQILALEEGFGWKRGPLLLGDIKLSGKIDRLDIVDGSEKILRIVDYKTGKQKTINHIEGNVGVETMSARERGLPAPIRGAMKRQLLFYKLLLSLDPLYRSWTVGSAVFDFVEQEKDKFVKRSFTLGDDDVVLLQDLIKTVVNEIRSLKFLD